jgi:hypothetical protein
VGADGQLQEPVCLVTKAITVPDGESLPLLDTLLMMATNQFFPVISGDYVVSQASGDVMLFSALIRTWRHHTVYNPEEAISKAVIALLSLRVYDEQRAWHAIRGLFENISTFQSRDFEALRGVCIISST